MKDIAKNIRNLRMAKNLTQDDLAEKLFVTRQTVSNYETGKSRPDVDMLVRIAEVLGVDIQELIYGPSPRIQDTERRRLIVGMAVSALLWLVFLICAPIARRHFVSSYFGGWFYLVMMVLRPIALLCSGWTVVQVAATAWKRQPPDFRWSQALRRILIAALILWFLATLWIIGAEAVNDYLYDAGIRGEWVEVQGTGVLGPAWRRLPAPIPEWLNRLFGAAIFRSAVEHYWIYAVLGALLWVLNFPKQHNP